jgi:hypothetical protein
MDSLEQLSGIGFGQVASHAKKDDPFKLNINTPLMPMSSIKRLPPTKVNLLYSGRLRLSSL